MSVIKISDIMTRDAVSVSPDTNLLDCAKKMVRKKVGSLLIVEKKNLKGFISQKDILWALVKKSKKDLKEIKAKDISPKKVYTIRPSLTIKEAVKRMRKIKYERLPVVQNKEVIGIITARDILNFNPSLYPELEEFSKIREEARKLRSVKSMKQDFQGICEECGEQDFLYRVNGMLICESCKNS